MPMSNLSVVSNLLERLMARRLLKCLISSFTWAAYRPHHSIETGILQRWTGWSGTILDLSIPQITTCFCSDNG